MKSVITTLRVAVVNIEHNIKFLEALKPGEADEKSVKNRLIELKSDLDQHNGVIKSLETN